MSEEEKNKNVDKNNQHRNSENSEQNNDNEENTEESKKENNDNARESEESKEPEDTDETGQSESKKSSLDNVKYQREVSFLENSRDLSYQSLPSMDSNLTETGYTDSITYGEGYIEPTDKVLYPRLKEELFPEDEDLTSDPLRNAVAERRISETTMITHKAIAKQYGSYGNRYAKRDSSKIYGTDSVLYTELREEGHFLYFILPPDGGTGWIVTLISFLCQLLVSGILYAIGPILPHISADLGLSDVKVTLIPTVQIGLFFLCMPFSTALFNSYGFYRINLCGASFAAIAMFGASYCTQIETLLLSFSILGGPALSILYISSILRISLFFQKYRSLAYAMTCSGTGAGLVVFFFVNNYILAEYNWRQVMKCHSILFGILFLILLKRVKITPKRIFKIEIPTTSLGSMMVEEFPREVPVRKLSDVHTITFENKKIGELFVPFTPPTVFTPGLSERILLAPCKFEDVHVYSSNHILKPDLIEIKDIFYTGPVKYIFPEDAFLLLQESSLFLIANEDDTLTTHYILSMVWSRRIGRYGGSVMKFCVKLSFTLSVLLNLKLLTMPKYLLMLTAVFFFALGFTTPYIYSYAHSKLQHPYELLPGCIIGISIMLFSISGGFVVYFNADDILEIFCVCVIFSGIALSISAFYGRTNVCLQCLYAFFFGIAPALHPIRLTVGLEQLVGFENLSNAYSLSCIATAIAVFIAYLVFAYMRLCTGNYVYTFAISGICLIISGILKTIVRIIV